ncbi:MAG: PSD1 domain-containing protein [Verrucomicrobiaceae bacterium]|nr:PSD1 domain-containing protein [Verrucomicrobiaceae bacterium]
MVLQRILFSLSLVALAAKVEAVDFVKEVQPVLAKHCVACHGPKKQEAAFRLDHKPSALKGGDFGVAIVPGKAAESRMVHAVLGTNPKMRMPRKGDPLSASEIDLIKRWIDEGAVWPDSASAKIEQKTDHWAFKSVVRPQVPSGAAHPIDAFVRQRLAKEGLFPAPQAPLHTLVRRLHLDITGLPPSPEEVQVVTSGKVSLEARMEQLLSSPHYGERWGRHWLDAARYADSNGYEKDPMRYIYFYRDWVISAFNRDLPYDQFIIEQLAGDLLPGATQDQIVATGFLRNSMVNEEGGVDPEQFRMEAMFDRMDAIGKSILGLTINCVQCHDHKYDPISQADYYRMFAFLNNDNEPWRVVYTADQQMMRTSLLQQIKEKEDALKHRHPDWEQRMKTWIETQRKQQPAWTTLKFEDDPSGGEKALRQPDGSILAQGYAPTKSDVTFTVKVDKPMTIGAFRLDLMNDPNLPAYGPGRSQKGTMALTEFSTSTKAGPLKFVEATADFGEPENTPLVPFAKDQDASKDKRVTGPVTYAIDGKPATAWGIDAGPGRRNVPRNAVFRLEKAIEVTPESALKVTLSMKHGGWNSDDLQTMNLGRYKISATSATVAKATLPETFSAFRTTVAEWKPVNDEIEALWKQHPEGATTLVLDSREQPRMTSVLKRGDFLKPADAVTAGVPAVLHPITGKNDGTRLAFARWMVDKRSPTVARAFVNRVWQAYFGNGLTGTPEDFGTQGELPSHPELLDWLAAEFMQPSDGKSQPWSIKHLHRLILTSATYRQSSKVSPQLLEKDPFNRLLARGPRFRVEGEVVRDIQLAVSGLLNREIGGRPVMPPAPQHLFEKPASYAPFPWKSEEDAQKYRRAVYTFRRRSTPYPFLSTFDVPNGETSCVRRARSNTPMQALMTLNETLSIEAALALGKVVDEKGIPEAFARCTGRTPSAKELEMLNQLLVREKARGGELPPAAVVARVLLNLDETITKE